MGDHFRDARSDVELDLHLDGEEAVLITGRGPVGEGEIRLSVQESFRLGMALMTFSLNHTTGIYKILNKARSAQAERETE